MGLLLAKLAQSTKTETFPKVLISFIFATPINRFSLAPIVYLYENINREHIFDFEFNRLSSRLFEQMGNG